MDGSLQRDHAVVDEDVGGVAVAVRQDIPQVAHVALRRAGVAVLLLEDEFGSLHEAFLL